MLQEISSLSVLYVGNMKPDHENIQQMLSDGFHCPAFFDRAADHLEFEAYIAAGKYDIILAEYAPGQFISPDLIGHAARSGVPVVYLLDTAEADAALRLLDIGAAGCVLRNDPAQLLTSVYIALKKSGVRTMSRHENTSSQKEHFIEDLLYNLTDAFYAVDHDWRVTFINRKAEDYWGCKRDDMLGKVFWDCLPHLRNIPNRYKHEIAMRERIPMGWETSSPDRQRWADLTAYPTHDGGLAVFFRDVTEKRQAEEMLRLSRERQMIMLRLSDSLRPLDNPGDIQEAAARIIGEHLGADMAFYCDIVRVDGVDYVSIENVYSATDTLVPPDLYPMYSPCVLAKEINEGRNIVVNDTETDPRIRDIERPVLREHKIVAWVSVPFMKNGRFAASFTVHQGTARNWTTEEIMLIEEAMARTWAEVERVRAEIALRKSEQHALRLVSELEYADHNKNEFINALSHELRNPLAAIVASLSMLDLIDTSPSTVKARKIINRQTEQLCHLVDDLLDLTRITNNKIQLNVALFDLSDLAQTSVYDHRTLFEEKGVELVTEISAAPIYISADPVRISQIIGNLLHNACKFTERGGKTELTVCAQDKDAAIIIRDSGIGIESKYLPDLFKTFWQAEQNKGGLGLGLSIVKGIVELHGGTVVAESDGLNRGASFTVRLPLSEVPIAREAVDIIAEEHYAKPLRVLLIDDNRDLAEITCSLLTHCGYEMEAVYSGTDGIRRACDFLPNVIICDIGLPDIDGYEVARRISDCQALRDVFLISLSGYAQASDFEYSKEAGFNLHISKPVDIENLKTILASVSQQA